MSIDLETPVQFLKGVGPKISELLARKDIQKVGDILQWFPRAYEDRKSALAISELTVGTLCSFVGQVVGYREIPMGRSTRSIHELTFKDASGRISCKWFRTPFRNYFQSFKPGSFVRVTGEVKAYRVTKEIHHPDLRPVDSEGRDIDEIATEGLQPIYSETEGLNQKLIRKIVANVIETSAHLISETLPEWLMKKYNLTPLRESLEKVHKPGESDITIWQNFKDPHQRRLIFEEFFWLELTLARSKNGITREKAIAFKALTKISSAIREALPFKLTEGQEKVLSEITQDVMKAYPMHRLIQGDVGCGKTIVALFAAALTIENGFQAALMAPTEILCEQHYLKARELFDPLGVKVIMLSGGMKTKISDDIKTKIKSGEAQLIIGTHALIQDSVEFKNLALVIIDEQHRFGVKQRAQLKQKGVSPHFLIMTATPIPRTLAMTVYGDLDVSVIKEMPKGRQPITTRIAYENKRLLLNGFIRDQLTLGRQAYIIYPLVEETEKMDLKNATDQSKILEQEFSPFTVGLLHGRLKSEEKEQLMLRFKKNEIQVLVSTTVVEVGVDVPNASIMVVEHAERFGLSQLHQLRGRVGRGAHKSFCVLVSGRALSDEGKRRLEVMTQTNDGFKIAEEDLIIRGAGEFLGTRQSGLAGFKLANLVRDVEILSEARQAAFEVLKQDPKLQSPDNVLIHQALIEKKRPALLFAGIG